MAEEDNKAFGDKFVLLERGKGRGMKNPITGPLRKKLSKRAGFTLMELVIAIGILALVLVGLLQVFVCCLSLSELAGNSTIAISKAQGKLEEIRNHSFNSIVVDYSQGESPGNIFDLTQLNGKGVIYIDDTNPELLEIEIVVSWQEKGNRIIGEDSNLNGALDTGEDDNGNGKLDSPVSLVSMIAKR
ncbi:MAG: prepilin-type N-terminal cleavage/methylation domain-containing protein [Candidatus Omnitrophica bacterium]|nr:prepilin-type N-terminal cleavage/methylation domain-containing protein [Candidatus Omnitrophota bacterium]